MLERPDRRTAQPTIVTPSSEEKNAIGANACRSLAGYNT